MVEERRTGGFWILDFGFWILAWLMVHGSWFMVQLPLPPHLPLPS